MENKSPLEEGTFVFGANYWASHAGTRMWRDWDERVGEEDFHRFPNLHPQMRVYLTQTAKRGCHI